jgi:hypothetical protein
MFHQTLTLFFHPKKIPNTLLTPQPKIASRSQDKEIFKSKKGANKKSKPEENPFINHMDHLMHDFPFRNRP